MVRLAAVLILLSACGSIPPYVLQEIDAGSDAVESDSPADAAVLLCGAWDAVGIGDACNGILGWSYDGSHCYRVVGCACVGVDCGHLYNDALPCGFDHAACPHGAADGGSE